MRLWQSKALIPRLNTSAATNGRSITNIRTKWRPCVDRGKNGRPVKFHSRAALRHNSLGRLAEQPQRKRPRETCYVAAPLRPAKIETMTSVSTGSPANTGQALSVRPEFVSGRGVHAVRRDRQRRNGASNPDSLSRGDSSSPAASFSVIVE